MSEYPDYNLSSKRTVHLYNESEKENAWTMREQFIFFLNSAQIFTNTKMCWSPIHGKWCHVAPLVHVEGTDADVVVGAQASYKSPYAMYPVQLFSFGISIERIVGNTVS